MNLHKEVKKILKGNMTGIIFAFLFLGLINYSFNKVADSILPTEATSIQEEINEVKINEDMSVIPNSTGGEYLAIVYEKPYSYSITKAFLSDIISFVFHGALSLSILDLIKAYYNKEEAEYRVSGMFSNLKTYYKELFLLSTLMSTISVVLSLIPFIGPLVFIIMSILLIFVVLLIPENREEGPFTLFKKSAEKSKGYRLKIVAINTKYLFLPLAVFILGIIFAGFISSSNAMLAIAFLNVVIIAVLVTFIRAAVYNNTSIPLLYYQIDTKYRLVDGRGFVNNDLLVGDKKENDNEIN